MIFESRLPSLYDYERSLIVSALSVSDSRRDVYLENLSKDLAAVSEINNLLAPSIRTIFDLTLIVTNMRSIHALD